MLRSHIEAVENSLLAISQIPANSGHTLHMGTPRETFIREFLEKHLSSTVAIGTGEIIDSNSQPGQRRNQFDIVIYKRNYPKIDFGGGINGFLAESVVATIEVKSTIDQVGLTQAVKAASRAKSLTRNIQSSFSSGYIPPSILNYVVAYGGPVNMATVHGWLQPIHTAENIAMPVVGPTTDERSKTPSPSVDGIFVLGKGFIQYDNSPIGFINDQARNQNPNIRWAIGDCTSGSLLLFFVLLLQSTNNVQGAWLDPLPYLSQFRIPNLSVGA